MFPPSRDEKDDESQCQNYTDCRACGNTNGSLSTKFPVGSRDCSDVQGDVGSRDCSGVPRDWDDIRLGAIIEESLGYGKVVIIIIDDKISMYFMSASTVQIYAT